MKKKRQRLAKQTWFQVLFWMVVQAALSMQEVSGGMTGNINRSRLVIAAILSFYPVATNTLAGFQSVEKDKYDLMVTYAAKKSSLFFHRT